MNKIGLIFWVGIGIISWEIIFSIVTGTVFGLMPVGFILVGIGSTLHILNMRKKIKKKGIT